MGTESVETRELTRLCVKDIRSQAQKKCLAMFVYRVDREGRDFERKQQIAGILSFPAHRDGSRCIVKQCLVHLRSNRRIGVCQCPLAGSGEPRAASVRASHAGSCEAHPLVAHPLVSPPLLSVS